MTLRGLARRHTTAVAYLALFAALGGSSYAAIRVDGNQVVDNSLRSKDLRNNDIRGMDVRADTLTGSDINERTLEKVSAAVSADNLAGKGPSDFAAASHQHDDRYFTKVESDARYVAKLDESVFASGQIREDGSIFTKSSRVTGATRAATGLYCVSFSPTPSPERLAGAVAGKAGTYTLDSVVVRITNGQGADCPSGQLSVRTHQLNGTATDGRFSFIVP